MQLTIQPIAQQVTPAQVQQATPEASTAKATTAHAATVAKAKPDTVTISMQAMLLNSPGYSSAEEATESPAAKAAEKMKGQR